MRSPTHGGMPGSLAATTGNCSKPSNGSRLELHKFTFAGVGHA